ncbi:response regulator [Halonotius terrestris]|uniref:Response regulator n=1 Tax=Halonotius terrestris TaxID=2487750 RepID=A0A8J8TCA7_9EURY|nr:response regulator [Halonotius terrestris]TQQ83333.1 response regulator [Halonotius terrestris]
MSDVSRLLYVDSDTDTAASRAAVLSDEYGFEVYTAGDIDTATTALQTNAIECVISEFELGDADGFDLLSHIRSDYGSLPVILLTDDEPTTVDSGAFKSGTTALFRRSEIDDSFDPLVDRIHELHRQATERQETVGVDDAAGGGREADRGEATSAGGAAQREQSGATIPLDSLLDAWATGDLRRERLEALGKDELITLLLELQDMSIAAADDVDAPHPTAAESGVSERPPNLDLSPGTKFLVQSTGQDDRKYDLHRDLLGLDDEHAHNVLLIRYRPFPPERLETIASNALNVTVISVGCHQPIPPAVRDSIETIRITNPGDVRRLGILATRIVNQWRKLTAGIRVSIDPLQTLFNYKAVEAVFRFMHALLGKLSSRGAVTQVHVNPSAAGVQNTNTIKMLFDYLLTVDSQGVTLEDI